MESGTMTAWEKFVRMLRKEPKKAAALAALLAVMGFVVVQRLGGGPKKAAAALPSVKAAVAKAKAQASADSAAAAVGEWLVRPISPVSRNLFAVKPDYFPRDTNQIEQVLREPTGSGFWDQLAKSMTARADLDNRRRVLIDNLRLQAAQNLKLETTMISHGKPRALINGTSVEEGDVVAGFRLVRIEARRIVVEREGIKLEVLFE